MESKGYVSNAYQIRGDGKIKIISATIKFVIFCLLWQILEIKFYGEVQPRIVDDIISLILFYYILKGELK